MREVCETGSKAFWERTEKLLEKNRSLTNAFEELFNQMCNNQIESTRIKKQQYAFIQLDLQQCNRT